MLVPDDAAVIEHVNSWPARDIRDIPSSGDRSLGGAAVPPGTPGDLLLLQNLLEPFPVGIAIDAKNCKRLAFETLNERPLVRVRGPAGPSPVAPEIEDHHLAQIVAQAKLLAVDIFSFNLGGELADLKVAQLE